MVAQAYGFEDPQSYLSDFGVSATVGSVTGTVILSQPGQDIMGGRIASNEYEIWYQTSVFPSLTYNTGISVAGQGFLVLQAYMEDDGVFSRARLQLVTQLTIDSTTTIDSTSPLT